MQSETSHNFMLAAASSVSDEADELFLALACICRGDAMP